MFALNVHAAYACGRSGACCTAGWSIPVEAHLQSRLGVHWLVPDSEGTCPEFDRPSALCRLQRDHGEAMLPESCHHFPRRALIDDRGTSIALSLFCPTAAALLLDTDGPLAVVENPSAFPLERTYDGLDARGEWPPLLRPDVLFDPESFTAWERFLVGVLGASADSVEATLARIAGAGERLRPWHAGGGTLLDWTTQVLRMEAGAEAGAMPDAAARYRRFTGTDAFIRVAASVPAGLTAPTLPPRFDVDAARLVAPLWDVWAPQVLRYLGARAFASWTAYQSRGLRAQLAELHVAAAVLFVECVRACQARGTSLDRRAMLDAVRASDLLLVHLANRDALVAWIGEAEHDARA